MPTTDSPLAPDPAWAYVVSRVEGTVGAVHRAGLLTHYLAQLILDDARRARCGDRLELTLPQRASDPAVVRILDRLPEVAARGVQVTVHRGT